MFFIRYKLAVLGSIVLAVALVSGCSSTIPASASNTTGPAIVNITTSSKVLAKSDCIPTSLSITSNVIDSRGVESVALWYRVGTDQNFTQTNMTHGNGNQYTATIKALDIPGGEYGTFEFYIIAQNKAGAQTKSSIDKSVELTRCVG